MQKTFISDKGIIRLATSYIEGNPDSIWSVVEIFQITTQEIGKISIPNSHLSGNPLAVTHRKRIIAAGSRLRKAVADLAERMQVVTIKKPIPTEHGFILSRIAKDGQFLAEEAYKTGDRTLQVKFVDPLQKKFIELIQTKMLSPQEIS